jgi:hypothetical protein
MSPKPKDDREEAEDVADEAAAEGTDVNKAAAAAYGRRTITKSGKFPKTPSAGSTKPSSKSQSNAAPISIREEGKLMGSSGTSRYTLVAPRTGKKKKADPPAE